MSEQIYKYNPSLLDDEALRQVFVARLKDLQLLLRVIRENSDPENEGQANQHLLVIGPRGSGKTTLLLRTALEIRQDSGLDKKWYPLVFAEESYEVVSAGEFWLEALFHLGEQTGDLRWQKSYTELKREQDENRLRERALGHLLDFADSIGKRILLVVENLNMLFTDQMSDDEAWKLRHTMSNEPRLMLLASATSRFEGIDNARKAFYDLFKLQFLPPLDDAECNGVWAMISGAPLEGEKIRPVRILTGGNLRLLTIISKFGANRSFHRLIDDLVSLVDDHTEYFKSHLDTLAVKERKVYLALAERWDYSTAREVSEDARLDVNTTSSLLKRLADRGAVEIQSTGKRTHLYAVAERMYNIYYLMRRRGKPSDRIQTAIRFMVSLYDPADAVRLIFEEARSIGLEQKNDLYLACSGILQEINDQEKFQAIIQEAPEDFLDSPHGQPYVSEREIAYYVTGKKAELSSDLAIAKDLFKKALSLHKAEKHAEAIMAYDEILQHFGDKKEPAIMEQIVTRALVAKGITLGLLGRSEEALELTTEFIANDDMVQKNLETAIALFIDLAARGQAEAALKILTASPSVKHLEPLEIGLRLFLGETVRSAPTLREVAEDVVKRIEKRQAELKATDLSAPPSK
ncbi:hypothetical protein LJC24_00315 [Desulfococcaceae bacterium OttesenSCG-928-F15]|nr:hypothetical protein [Desulfococcaceae bacterium OttesenSCG-928-F15]